MLALGVSVNSRGLFCVVVNFCQLPDGPKGRSSTCYGYGMNVRPSQVPERPFHIASRVCDFALVTFGGFTAKQTSQSCHKSSEAAASRATTNTLKGKIMSSRFLAFGEDDGDLADASSKDFSLVSSAAEVSEADQPVADPKTERTQRIIAWSKGWLLGAFVTALIVLTTTIHRYARSQEEQAFESDVSCVKMYFGNLQSLAHS